MNNFTKYTILLAATSLCTINAANAVEKGKFYASGSYGVGFADKFDYKDEDLAVKKPSNANVFGAAIGYGVSDNIRAELSYNGFYGMKYKSVLQISGEYAEGQEILMNYHQKVTANALFASAYYDINKFGQIKPYIGAGVGISKVKSGNMFSKDNQEGEQTVALEGKSKSQFAWQLGTGVNYVVNDKIDLNLVNYRYSNLGKVHLKENNTDPDNQIPALNTKLAVHSISTGITFKF